MRTAMFLLFLSLATQQAIMAQYVPPTNTGTVGNTEVPDDWNFLTGSSDIASTTSFRGQHNWQVGTIPTPPTGHTTFVSAVDAETSGTTITGLIAGATYNLSFYHGWWVPNASGYACNPNLPPAITIDGVQTVLSLSCDAWMQEDITFTASGSTASLVVGGVSCTSGCFTASHPLYSIASDAVTLVNAPPCTDPDLYADNCDFDGDGILNAADLDDDNDGILDSDECVPNELFIDGSLNSGGSTWVQSGSVFGPWNGGARTNNLLAFALGGNSDNGGAIEQTFSTIPGVNASITFQAGKLLNGNSGPSGVLEVSANGTVIETITDETENNLTSYSISFTPSTNSTTIRFEFTGSASELDGGVDFDIAQLSYSESCGDSDGDGLANSLDTDSDGDGCPDAIEGEATFVSANLDANDMLTGGVDADGIPTAAGTSGQAIGTSQDNTTENCTDTDGDLVEDYVDLDDDNDGIVDTLDNNMSCVYTDFTNPIGTSQIDGDSPNINNNTYTGTIGPNSTSTAGTPVQGDANGNLTLAVIGNSELVEYVVDFTQSTNVTIGPEDGGVGNFTVADQFQITTDSGSFTVTDPDTIINATLSNGGSTVNFTGGAGTTWSISVEGTTSLNFQMTATTSTIQRGPIRICTEQALDSDLDGIVNALDNDSDDDGCADAIEGGAAFTYFSIDGNQRLKGGIDANGVPTVAAGGQTAGSSADASTRLGCANTVITNRQRTFRVKN